MNALERRLRRLQSASTASDQFRFVIIDRRERPMDERLRMLGILDLPGRIFAVISVVTVHPGPQPDGPLPPNVGPYKSGNGRYEPVGLRGEDLNDGPHLANFGLAHGPVRPGREWVREI